MDHTPSATMTGVGKKSFINTSCLLIATPEVKDSDQIAQGYTSSMERIIFLTVVGLLHDSLTHRRVKPFLCNMMPEVSHQVGRTLLFGGPRNMIRESLASLLFSSGCAADYPQRLSSGFVLNIFRGVILLNHLWW